jgi:hypothetical protein
VLSLPLVFVRIGIVHAVGRIREGHVGRRAVQHLFYIGQDPGIPAQHPVLATDPEVAGATDWLDRRPGGIVSVLIGLGLCG